MCNTGFISDIQRFSLGDGPGIRTTVFMQGCNLRCPWCHNPETLSKAGSLLLYENLCVSCGGCKKACPENIIDNCTIADRSRCILCGKCANVCTGGAVKLSGKHMTVSEVHKIVSEDTEFYAKSNGGVTISGGEPLLQPDFCEGLAKKCFENGISVIIDTVGDTPFSAFEALIPFTDCFYFDIKTDIEGYKKIGGDGERVYDNLKRLTGICGVVVRIPVIPGFNDNAAMMEKISRSAAGYGVGEVHLLPFHRLGSGKYKALGLSYAYEKSAPENDGTLERFGKIFRIGNIKILLEE